MDYQLARENMVHSQVRPSDVTDLRISGGMLNIMREAFVPSSRSSIAYSDEEVLLNTSEDYCHKRYMLEPAHLAKLIQLLKLKSTDVVLEIGCGTGYASAVLSNMCESVIAIDEDATLVETADRVLAQQGFDTIAVVQAPLNAGLPEQGPYDSIFIGGQVEAVPQNLLNQLKDGGRLVAVVGTDKAASAYVYTRNNDRFSAQKSFSASVATLPGFAKDKEFVF